MKAIFLSASTPDPRRDPKYSEGTDLSAIRDAVRALVTVAVPGYRIVWGGHPSITPLVRVVVESLKGVRGDQFGVFQSDFFRKILPKDNAAFERIVMTPRARLTPAQKAAAAASAGAKAGEEEREKAITAAVRDRSLAIMRREMIGSEAFQAAFFVGGMEGVEEEYRLFRDRHRGVPLHPVASTGGAALLLYRQHRADLDPSLATDRAYPSLFRKLLGVAPP